MPNRSHFRSNGYLEWRIPFKRNSGTPAGSRTLAGSVSPEISCWLSQQLPDPLAISTGSIVSDTCQGRFHNFSHVVDVILMYLPKWIAAPFLHTVTGGLRRTYDLSWLHNQTLEPTPDKLKAPRKRQYIAQLSLQTTNWPANSKLFRSLFLVACKQKYTYLVSMGLIPTLTRPQRRCHSGHAFHLFKTAVGSPRLYAGP